MWLVPDLPRLAHTIAHDKRVARIVAIVGMLRDVLIHLSPERCQQHASSAFSHQPVQIELEHVVLRLFRSDYSQHAAYLSLTALKPSLVLTTRGYAALPTPAPIHNFRLYLLGTARLVLPRILVLEDTPINQQVARGMLARLGYRADVAPNGRAALDALGRTAYGAVLMDCHMPELDGFAATRELRRREGARRHTPIIAMTASALPGQREKCLAAGMDDYLTKPVRLPELEAVLRRWTAAAAPASETGSPQSMEASCPSG